MHGPISLATSAFTTLLDLIRIELVGIKVGGLWRIMSPGSIVYFSSPIWNWASKNLKAQRNWHLHACQSEDCVVEVRVYSNAACVDLFLNGATQGRQAMPRYGHLDWNVTFAPGNITARSYSSCGDSDIIDEVVRVTTGPPVKLKASFKDNVDADGINADEVALIQVDVLDAFDRLVPVPNEYPVLVRFEVVAGAGT